MITKTTVRTMRRALALLSIVALLASLAWLLLHQRRPETPNVILVVIDTLRFDHLSQYGYELATSPGFDIIADHATRYERAYAPSSWTVPSTASLLSGMWPVRHGTRSGRRKLSPDLVTLAEVLEEHGFQTAGVSHNIHVSAAGGFAQGFETFIDHQGHVRGYPDVSRMVTNARDWLAHRDPARPFFLYLHAMNCHGPYRVPRRHQRVLLGRRPLTGFRFQDRLQRQIMAKGMLEKRGEVTEDYLRSYRETYDVAVRYTSDQIGSIFEAIDPDVLDNTLVVITSDHGEEMFDHQGFGHAYTLFEEVVRIPLLVKLPGQDEPAALQHPVSLLDVYPTVLQVAGIDIDHHLDGLPLPVPGSDTEPKPNRALLFDVRYARRAVGRGLLAGGMKLILMTKDYERLGEKTMLFDLERDPGELHNLAIERPEMVDRFRRQIDALWTTYGAEGLDPPTRDAGEMDLETLRALGYVD